MYVLEASSVPGSVLGPESTTGDMTEKVFDFMKLHLNSSIPETSQIPHHDIQMETDGSSRSYQGGKLPSPPALIHTDTFTMHVNIPQDVHARVCSQCISLNTYPQGHFAHTYTFEGTAT